MNSDLLILDDVSPLMVDNIISFLFSLKLYVAMPGFIVGVNTNNFDRKNFTKFIKIFLHIFCIDAGGQFVDEDLVITEERFDG